MLKNLKESIQKFFEKFLQKWEIFMDFLQDPDFYIDNSLIMEDFHKKTLT